MSDHRERLKIEHEELDARLEKLHVFIQDSEVYRSLPHVEREDLRDQLTVMRVYRNILRKRLARMFDEETPA